MFNWLKDRFLKLSDVKIKRWDFRRVSNKDCNEEQAFINNLSETENASWNSFIDITKYKSLKNRVYYVVATSFTLFLTYSCFMIGDDTCGLI